MSLDVRDGGQVVFVSLLRLFEQWFDDEDVVERMLLLHMLSESKQL